MNLFLVNLRPTLVSLFFFTLLFGGAYPLISTLIIKTAFPKSAEGSLIEANDGQIYGSHLIGQNFNQPEYFWGRISSVNYDASSSAGSNFSANNQALLEIIKARIAQLKKADPDNQKPIPVDLVTASASGLDPHISIAAAKYQITRIAKARRKSETEIKEVIDRYIEKRQFGILGESRINVLQLNLALDGKI